MELTKKVLDFWTNTTASIEYAVREIIKNKLREEGKSEHHVIFYCIDIDGNFPIKVKTNTSCSCHPEWDTAMTISKEDIIKLGV